MLPPGSTRLVKEIGNLLAGLLRVLRRIPVVDDAIQRVSQGFMSPVFTRLIRDPSDSDLDAALQLYQRRIPEDQRFDPTDIIRWIRDDQLTRHLWSTHPTDWFVVAKYRRRITGFVLFHYYPKRRFAFCAYMVVADAPASPANAVSAALCSRVSRLLKTRKELATCERIIFEVEDPRKELTREKQDQGMARVRRFCALAQMHGLTIRALDIDYRQPKLSLDDICAVERPLLLMSAPVSMQVISPEIGRTEVERILSFIYLDLYPEGYSDNSEENRQYRRYCSSFCDAMLAALPDSVRSIRCADLVSQVRNMKPRAPRQRKARRNSGELRSAATA